MGLCDDSFLLSNDVAADLSCQSDGFLAISYLRFYQNIVFRFQDATKPFTKQRVIVDDENPNG